MPSVTYGFNPGNIAGYTTIISNDSSTRAYVVPSGYYARIDCTMRGNGSRGSIQFENATVGAYTDVYSNISATPVYVSFYVQAGITMLFRGFAANDQCNAIVTLYTV